jgi:mRNA interferase YafQ
MTIRVSSDFKKRAKKLSSPIKRKLEDRLRLFSEDPYNTLLRNHALTGEWSGYRSINITGDYRAVYQSLPENTAYFIDIGTHSYLYS